MALWGIETDQARPLKGARVLVVEDEYFIADDLKRILEKAGARVSGPVATLKSAHQSVNEGDFDFAVVDLNLRGESALPIADRLLEQQKPFVIATGYDSAVVPERLSGVSRIEKPFDERAFLQVVGQLRNR